MLTILIYIDLMELLGLIKLRKLGWLKPAYLMS